MREWEEEISQWLVRSKPDPACEAEIVKELIRRLDDHYQTLHAQGATEQEACRATLAELNEGRLFAPSPQQGERPIMRTTCYRHYPLLNCC